MRMPFIIYRWLSLSAKDLRNPVLKTKMIRCCLCRQIQLLHQLPLFDSMLVFTKALLAKATSSAGNLSLANIHNAMGWAYMHRGFLIHP